MLIDTHCHLNFVDFKEDHLDVAKRALSEDIQMIVVGSEYKTSLRAANLANSFSNGIYAAIGLHPIHLEEILIKNDNENGKYEFRSRAEDFIEDDYQKIIDKNKKIKAIGEIGLDYYHIEADSEEKIIKIKNRQKEIFIKQLNFAKKNKLPVIIHCREAHDDLYNILNNFYQENKFTHEWGVIHCFSGDYELAQKYFALGLKISFTGLITFNKQWDEIIRKSPLEKMMVETDSPYLSPVPYRGKRNEPLYVRQVAQKIAEIRGISLEEIEKRTYSESKKFFNL
ncbi:MAG TPA: TatD family hydrolase [bacterium]|nr:TatD family hydrolase [bacterium]